ncbi:MAG TPA: helix-turn-helix domain-containing protein [Solirubrobacteraceae bacterium]
MGVFSGPRSRERHLLSTGEAAAELGVHERTLRRYLSSGQLRYRRLPGGHYRIPVEAIEEFWRANDADGSTPARRRGTSSRREVRAAATGGGGKRSRRPSLGSTAEQASYDLSPQRLQALREEYR